MPPNRVAVTVLAAALAVTVACGTRAEDPGLFGRDAIRIATKIDQPGIGNYTDPSGASLAGLDIDVANYVARALKVRDIKWTHVRSKNREDLITSGDVDLVIASYSITDYRKQYVAFAGPYLIAGQDVMVRADDDTITSVEDLKAKNKRVCSATNSTSVGRLLNHYQIPKQSVLQLYGYRECVGKLVKGQVDAVSTDDVVLIGYSREPEFAGKVRVLGRKFSEERYGIGLAKGRQKDCTKIVEILQQMMRDGSWQRFVETNLGAEWLGKLPQPNPEESSCTTPPEGGSR